MTEVLDFLYSSNVWMTVVFIVVIFLCVGFAFANPFKNKTLNYTYKIFLYAFAFCFMMSFNFLYYGYTTEFKRMYIGNTTICLFEEAERGGDGPSENVTRIHIIDKNTGVRKERFYNGPYGEIVGMRNDTMCYLTKDDVVLYDAANLKEIYNIKDSNWGTLLSDLSVGMESISGNQNSNDPEIPLIVLNCKNGKKYWFDPFAKKIMEKEPLNTKLHDFSKTTYELSIEYKPGYDLDFLKDEYAGDKLKRIVPGEYGKRFFTGLDSTAYLEPFFLCIDTLKKAFVFGYYTTTDRNDFYIEAKNFEFKPLWKKLVTEIATDETNIPKLNVWQYANNILYFSNGGFVIALDPLTGKTNWITRL